MLKISLAFRSGRPFLFGKLSALADKEHKGSHPNSRENYMKISRTGYLSLTLLTALSLASPAMATNTVQAEVQDFSIRNSEAHFITNTGEKYQVRLITEHNDVNSALVMTFDPPVSDLLNFSFDFAKNERGLFFRSTTNPIVRVEYTLRGQKQYLTHYLNFFKQGQSGSAFIRATAKKRILDNVNAAAVINRIAVVAKAETAILLTEFADFDVRNFEAQGQQIPCNVNMTIKRDPRSDKLLLF